MNRSKYIDNHRKNNYDRLEVLLPKGQKEVLASVCIGLGISVNEYVRTLIANDLQGNKSALLTKSNISDTVDPSLLNKWQIPKKYRLMIESATYSKENGYFIRLKDGYINSLTNTKIIHVYKLDELRLAINKSHKI
ncbi:MAG: hypothetical protein E7A67_01020 [Peptostreptococcus anaerobius]|jgi:hypothetical protein|uniref:hypothetical protein n=1 Tax=Peptostreptococcus anaerobius TaxID=1261 RepID=UPI0029044D2F|nr:hypothetical protein [Peptostreptococcus anaerobius]MDU0963577.1 hypothetical protein [Peptostreptococcus anaerobius]MDU0997465.1 hypothetical protein [Peptostreptococcus anaerobius]